MSIEPQLRLLIQLHRLDNQIRALRHELGRLPAAFQALQKEREQLDRSVQERHDAWKGTREAREEKELQVTKLEQQLENMQTAARQARSNREYSEMLLKIEDVRHRIRKTEDELLDLMEEEERTFQAWKAAQAEAAERLKDIAERERVLKGEQADLENRMQAAEQEREAFFQQIPKKLQALYQRIAAGREGVALAEVRDQTCTACHIQLRPRLYQSLMMMEEIVLCENCQRILYLPETQPVSTEAASRG